MSDDHQQPSPEHLKLQAILDNAVDAIISIDEQGIIDSMNPATETLFQYAATELLGKNVNMLMPAPYCDEHDRYLRDYLRTGMRTVIGSGREVVGQRKDGSTFPMYLAVSEITFEGRRIFTGIVRDISDVKAAERKLEKLNNELEDRVCQRTQELNQAQAKLIAREKLATLGQVAGSIAHEIRNPLNAVKTSAYYLLHAENASEEKQREHLERIDRQVSMIANVITALSDVAKLPDPAIAAIHLDSILAQALRDFSLPDEITMELQIPDNLLLVLGDELQLAMVFRNLLRNACDAMPSGGNIVVVAEQRADRVAISVSDNGLGISPEDLPRILEPLHSTKARGMGLGLAICRTILDKNHGRLQIDSQLGQGSQFTVELPAQVKAGG